MSAAEFPWRTLRYFIRLDERDIYAVVQGNGPLPNFDQGVQPSGWPRRSHDLHLVSFPAGTEPRVTWEKKTAVASGQFRLDDPAMASARLPLEIDRAAWDALPDSLQEQYHAAYLTTSEPRSYVLRAELLPMPVTAPPDLSAWPGVVWQPAAAYVETFGSAWAHLYPGQLTGFRAAELIRKHGEFYDHRVAANTTSVEVNLRVFWSPPKINKPTAKRGRAARLDPGPTQQWYTRTVTVPWRTGFAGATLDEALERLREYEAELTETLTEARTVKACGHCNGRGFVQENP